jgi:hypothetical protein
MSSVDAKVQFGTELEALHKDPPKPVNLVKIHSEHLERQRWMRDRKKMMEVLVREQTGDPTMSIDRFRKLKRFT